MSKHTPGPWRVSSANPLQVNTDKGGDSVGVAEANKYDSPLCFCDPNEADANARLIAAAPELLELLSEWLAKEDASTPDGYKYNETPYKAKVRAAIAKATAQ